MEIDNVRCLEVAAQLALVNMLKINLSCRPDIYRMLLAILCDFDPNEPDSKQKTSHYIRLLISDKMLARCIIVSLPQGRQERSELIQKTSDIRSKHSILPYKNSSSGGKRILLSQQAHEAEMISEAPNKSITIIVSGQGDLDDTQGLTDDRALSILGKPHPVNIQSKVFPANHGNKLVLNDKPLKCVGLTTSPASKLSGQGHTLSKRKESSWTCPSKRSFIEGHKISLALSCSSNQLVTTATSSITEYKQIDSVKAVRPKLVFPLRDVSQGSVSMPTVSSSSYLDFDFRHKDIKASFCQQQTYVNTYSPDYKDAQGYTAMSQSDTATSPHTDKTEPQIHAVRKSINTSENKIMKGIPMCSSTLFKVSTEAKRSASFGDEPASKVRKVAETVDEQVYKSNVVSETSNTESLQSFQPILDISYSGESLKYIDKLRNTQRNDLNEYDDLASCLTNQNNSINDSTLVTNSKGTKSEAKFCKYSSMQERENTLKPSSYSYMDKSFSQHSLLLPTAKDEMSTCKLTKQYHLSYPNTCRIAPEIAKKLSQTNYQESNQSVTESVSSCCCTSNFNQILEHPKYAASVSNTYSCGSTGTRSFPYQQQIHLSGGSIPALNFPIDFLINKPTVSKDSPNLVISKYEGKIKNSSQINETNIDSLKPFNDGKEAGSNITYVNGSQLDNSCNKKDSHLISYEEKDRASVSTISNEDDIKGCNNNNSLKQTFLIIETKTSNGSDQVQIKLNPGTSGNLLGELLKLKPGLGLKQSSSEPNITDYSTKDLETQLESNSEATVVNEQVTSIDSLLTLDDKNTLSDISDVASSNSEDFQCSDDQYEFSDQSDIYPLQLDVYNGEPKLVSLPTLNTTAFQQMRDESSDTVQSLTSSRPNFESYSSCMNTQMLPFSSSISAGLTDRFDPMSSVQTGSGDNGHQSHLSSCGMSPYLFGMIPDMHSSAYDDSLSLEGSDDGFLNEYMSPNSVRFRLSNHANGSSNG